jgi:hypothetical protein
MPLIAAEVSKVLLGAVGDRYERMYPDCSLVQFTQSGTTYLFDLASAVGAGQEDRTVAAWTITPASWLGRTPDQIRRMVARGTDSNLRPAAYSYFSLVLPVLLWCVLSPL